MSWWDSTLLLLIACGVVGIYLKLGGQLNDQTETVDVHNAYLFERLTIHETGRHHVEVFGRADDWSANIDLKHYDRKNHEWIGNQLWINEKGASSSVAEKRFEVFRDYTVAQARFAERRDFLEQFGSTDGIAEEVWLKAIHAPSNTIHPKVMSATAARGITLAGTKVYLDRETKFET